MDKRQLTYAAVALIAAFASYTLYQNTIILWDGYAYEVTPDTDTIPELTITLTTTDLSTNLLIRDALETAPIMVTEFATMDEIDTIIEDNSLSLDEGPVYIETDDASYIVTLEMYGGMEDQPIYLYAAGLLIIVALGLVVQGIRN